MTAAVKVLGISQGGYTRDWPKGFRRRFLEGKNVKICYVPKAFSNKTLDLVVIANKIISEYLDQGYKLTLRQLYYQFVARSFIPNTHQSYKRLGSILNNARLAGLVDWNAIEDRTRNLKGVQTWSSPAGIIRACASGYRLDHWGNNHYMEVWVEKEALSAVISRAVEPLDVSFLCCRGYSSQSEMHNAANRLLWRIESGMRTTILYLGDHDPSGMQMTKDIQRRLELFLTYHLGTAENLEVNRIALNMDQVNKYNPPPDPVKHTDSRAPGYVRRYGQESWELDALEPAVLHDLIQGEIRRYIDDDLWEEIEARQVKEKDILEELQGRWEEVAEYLAEN